MDEKGGASKASPPRLGRGLGALLSSTFPGGFSSDFPSEAPAPQDLVVGPKLKSKSKSETSPSQEEKSQSQQFSTSRIWQVPIEKMVPSAFQPREFFDPEGLQELSQSIRENGIIQPIVVKRLPNGSFEIVAGERRWRAAQMAGLHDVPVIIHQMDSEKTLEVALIENIQREDLNPMEEARAYLRLATEFQLTQQQIASRVGKDRTTVANTMRLNQLHSSVQQWVREGRVSMGQAKVLLSLPEEDQILGAKRVLEEGLSVRSLEKWVEGRRRQGKLEDPKDFSPFGNSHTRGHQENPERGKIEGHGEGLVSSSSHSSEGTKSHILYLTEELKKGLGTKVVIDYEKSEGWVRIRFYSDEELSQLVNRLRG